MKPTSKLSTLQKMILVCAYISGRGYVSYDDLKGECFSAASNEAEEHAQSVSLSRAVQRLVARGLVTKSYYPSGVTLTEEGKITASTIIADPMQGTALAIANELRRSGGLKMNGWKRI